MSQPSENLGFNLNVDVQRATASLSKVEKSIGAVEAAMAHASKTGISVDAGKVESSINAIEKSIESVAQTTGEAGAAIGDTMTHAANQVKAATSDMAKHATDDLGKVNKELEKHQQRLKDMQREARQAQAYNQPRGANGQFLPGGGGGGNAAGGGIPGASGGNAQNALEDELGGAAGAAAGEAGGGVLGSLLGPLGAIGGAIGGAITGHAIMGYITGAVREQSEEYIRETNLSSRLAGSGERTEDFSARIHEAGRGLYFTRGETMEAAEGMKGFSKGQTGVDSSDVEYMLKFTRSFGMQAGSTAEAFNRFAVSGAMGRGINGGVQLAAELARAIEKGDMRARAAEAMEAAAAALDDVTGTIGNLSDNQRQSVINLQTMFNSSGQEMFRGQRGAQVMSGMNAALKPDSGDDTHESLLNMALVKYGGMANASPVALLKRREEGISNPDNLRALFKMIQEISGGNTDFEDILLKQNLGLSGYRQAAELRKITKGLTYVPDAGLNIDEARGILDKGIERQEKAFNGRPRMARAVEQKSEEMRRGIGSIAFEGYKDFQGVMLNIGATITRTVEPAFKSLNDWLHSLANAAGVFNPVQGQGFDNPSVRGKAPVASGEPVPFPTSNANGTRGMTPDAIDFARQFHDRFGGTMSSGWRSPAQNEAANGVPNSDHLSGEAVDFTGVPYSRKKEVEEFARQHHRRALYHDAGSGAHWHFQPTHDENKTNPPYHKPDLPHVGGEKPRKPDLPTVHGALPDGVQQASIDFKQIFYVNGGNPDEVRRKAAEGARQAIAAHQAQSSAYMGA